MTFQQVESWTRIFSEVAPGLVLIFACYQYWRSVRTRRAEWLFSLFQRFYEESNYRHIRAILDSPLSPQFKRLESDIHNENEGENVESFVNYLNFFEFIAVLKNRGQLNQSEICDLFDYYLRNIKQRQFAVDYVRKQGFEHLDRLLKEI